MPAPNHARLGLLLAAVALGFFGLGFVYRIYLGPTSVLEAEVDAQDPEKPVPKADTSSQKDRSATAIDAKPGAESQALDPGCSERLTTARSTLESVPEELGGLTSEEADVLAAKVTIALRLCEQYLKECGSTGSAEAQFLTAKFLHLLSVREETDIRADAVKTGVVDVPGTVATRMTPFYRRLAESARAAYKGLTDEARRSECLELLGFALGKVGEHRGAVDAYLEHQRVFPTSNRSALIAAALGRAYIGLGDFRPGIEALEKALRDPAVYEGENYPDVHEFLWKLYEHQGDLPGLERVVDRVQKIFPLRLASPKIQGRVRQNYERYLDVFGFRKAYATFALGRSDEARELFRAHVSRLDAKRAELAASGRALEPVSDIYRRRSVETLEFLENLYGRPAPRDFDLGPAWATTKQVRLATSRGRVVAVVFRTMGDKRPAPFLRGLDSFATRNDDVELLSICYLQPPGPNASPETRLEEGLENLRRELSELGYRSAAGFDPDTAAGFVPDSERKTLFKTYGAYIGSATFLVFDREGRPVWFQQDPRPQDVRFAEAIIDRVRD